MALYDSIGPLYRQFSCDVLVMSWTKALSTPYTVNLVQSYQNATLNLELEDDESRAAADVMQSSNQGFGYAVEKAIGWSLDIEKVAAVGPAVTDRTFGWNLSVLDLQDIPTVTANANALLANFQSLEISVSCETMDARSPYDTNSPVLGWRYPRISRRTMELDLVGLVHAKTGEPAANIVNTYFGGVTGGVLNGVGVPFEIVGNGLTISGDAIRGRGSLNWPGEAATQNARLRVQGLPSITLGAGLTNQSPMLSAGQTDESWADGKPGFTVEATRGFVSVKIMRPGGAASESQGFSFTGSGFFTNSRLAFRDGGNTESGTITGWGKLADTGT